MNIETDKPVEITIATAPQTLTFEGETQPFMTIGTPEIKINSDHQDLKNLDYENSGHTGFASSEDIDHINEELSSVVQDPDYVHTDNNYTNEDKQKLEGIEPNANNYVLPDDVVQDPNYIHTDNNYTDEDKQKLEGIEPNANNYVLPDDVVQDENYVHTDNNYTDDDKQKLDNIESNANNYVLPNDVVQDSNYVHTDNNYTNEEKQKLDNIESNANNYVLPDDVVQDENYVHTDNNFTDDDKEKLNNIEANANNYVLPNDVVQDPDYVHTDNNYTNEEKQKLDNIESNANNYVLPDDVVQDPDYVHTDNNYTDEDKEKLQNLENMSGNASDIAYEDNTGQGVNNVQDAFDEVFSQVENLNNATIDGKNIPYEDVYGYGTPDNVQDALDFAFEEIDGKMTFDNVNSNFVSFNTNQISATTATQKQRARNNIGVLSSCVSFDTWQSISEANKARARQNINALGIKNLGEIDLADYDDDVMTFIGTLTDEGIYKFTDNSDYFTWVVETWWIGDYLVGQKYFYAEEGFTYQYYRNGYYDENSDTFTWDEWTLYLTYEAASNIFAPKSHTHYSTLTTSYDIRGYLDRVTNYNMKELRVTSSTNKHLYRVKVDYVNYNPVGGGTRYVRYQEYFDIEEPNKIYKRTGVATKITLNDLTWGDWYVFEGVAE